MKNIVILSDSHDLLRDEIMQEMVAADVILHAGDLCAPTIVEAIYACGEAHIVRGNNDYGKALPKTLTLTIEGLRFLMVHDRHDLPKRLPPVDVIVYGHSHRYSAERKEGVLWLNPGSCGRPRFGGEVCFCRMQVEGGAYHFEKVLLQPATASKRQGCGR